MCVQKEREHWSNEESALHEESGRMEMLKFASLICLALLLQQAQSTQAYRVCALPPKQVTSVHGPEVIEKSFNASVDHTDDSSLKAPRSRPRLPRAIHEVLHRGRRYLQLLIVTDEEVRDFHGDDLIQQYIMTQIYMVDEMYHHPSLGVEIIVGVSDIIILDKRVKRNIIVEYDGRRTLDHFCQWADKFRSTDVSDFDVAVYLTRDDIGPAGYAPVTGMCQSMRSCAVVRDDGISSAFVIAHELGHIFGMPHDGYDNHCSKDPDDGKIMAANVQSHFEHYYWTDCSRDSMEKYLDDLHCLHDKPLPNNWPLYERPFGVSWSLDEQCRQEFGDEFSQCKALPNMNLCDILWCSTPERPLFCKTKRSPPLPGTSCARNKWCMRGRCEAQSTVAVDGGWSVWSEWGLCSRTCGTGVQFRSRACSDPAPEYGGRECDGAADQRRLCNTQACLLMTDFRAEQCAEQNEVNFFGGRRHHWLPREADEDVCKITCISDETDHVWVSPSHVVDGTLCSYDTPHDICIKGECQKMGCDGEIGSNKTGDVCGVCGGNGTTCKKIKGTASRFIDSREYHHLVRLPERARSISITERNNSHLSHFLAVRDAQTEKWLLNGQGTEGDSSTFIVHGTNFIYTNNQSHESLTANGPLLAALEILVFSTTDHHPPTIDYEYTLSPHDAENVVLMGQLPEHHALEESAADEQRYIWIPRGWGTCSVTCGGGQQSDLYECLDTHQQSIVQGFCKLKMKPKPGTQDCNQHPCRYTFRWEAEGWVNPCSQACGTHGIQRRHIRCLVYVSPTEEREIDPPYCNLRKMPLYQRPCNQYPCESIRWRVTAWSMCSSEGVRSRRVWCEAGGEPYVNDEAMPCQRSEQPRTQDTCTPDVTTESWLKSSDPSETTDFSGETEDILGAETAEREVERFTLPTPTLPETRPPKKKKTRTERLKLRQKKRRKNKRKQTKLFRPSLQSYNSD